MSDRSTRSLHHGHRGDGSYYSVDRVWRYPTSNSDSALPLVLRDSRQPADGSISTSNKFNGDLDNGFVVEEVLKTHPEFLGARRAISHSLKASQVDDFQKLQDSPTGPLLCTVRVCARGAEKSDLEKDHTPVVAFVEGSNGDSLRLVPSSPRLPSPKFRKTPVVPFQAFYHPQGCTWKGNGETVRQICFSTQTKPMSALLAARFTSSVKVLTVKVPSPAVNSAQIDRVDGANGSRLKMTHIATLEASETLGKESSFVHVSFNPWKPTSVATVTSSGHWQIWNIDLRKGIANIVHDEVPSDEQSEKIVKGKISTHDGWYRIFWLGDKSTVLICTRSNIEIVNLGTGLRIHQKAIWGGESKVKTLEVLLPHSQPNDVFIITSSQVHWLRLCFYNGSGDDSTGLRPSLGIVLSWTHYRDRKDETLRLAHLDFSGEFFLYLYSRRSPLIVAYRIVVDSTDSEPPMQSSHKINPINVNLNSKLLVNGQLIQDLDIQPLLNDNLKPTQHGPSITSQSDRSHLIHCVTLTSDFCLDESVSLEGPKPLSYNAGVAKLASQVGPQDNQNREARNSQTFARSTDDFIVRDGDYQTESENTKDMSAFSTRYEVFSRKQQRDEALQVTSIARRNYPSISMQDLYQSALQLPAVNEKVLSQNLQVVFERLRELAQDGLISFMPLSSLLPTNRAVGDLTAFQKTAQDLEDSFISQFEMQYRFTSPAQMLGDQLGQMQDNSLSSIYQALVSDWHVPLSHRIPSQVRLAKERTLRRTAIDLYLSSRCILPTATLVPSQDQPSATEQTRAHQSKDGDPPSSAITTDNANSLAPTNNTMSVNESSAISRLRRYATIPDTSLSTSDAMKDILSHWKIGTDPSSYDYSATVAATAQAKARAEAQPKDSKRARLKRRAERQLSRSSNRDKRLSADPRVTASQPSVDQAPFFSSQDGRGSQMDSQNATSSQPNQVAAVASQVQSGRFGGRRLPTRPGDSQSKRKSGF